MTGNKRPSMRALCLLGESSLVREYTAASAAGGYAVQQILIHETGRPSQRRFRLPRGIRVVARPSRAVDLAIELTNLSGEEKRKNLVLLDRALPPGTLILSSSVTVTAAEQSGWMKHPERLVGIGAIPSLLGGTIIEFAAGPATDDRARKAAGQFAASLGKEPAFVRDSPGLILPRILCCLVNEAMFARQEGLATREDIDSAMKLGTNYPSGPFEFMGAIGASHVLAVMRSMHAFFGEDRYRPAPALRFAADADLHRQGEAHV